MVLATQNPIEHEGTYPLPEAQLDRFMLKVLVDYPTRDEEKRDPRPLRRADAAPDVAAGRDAGRRSSTRARALRDVHMDERLRDYIVHLVCDARAGAYRHEGPAAADRLRRLAARDDLPGAGGAAHAFIDGRGYVEPDDVKAVAMDVLRHRIVTDLRGGGRGRDGGRPRRGACSPASRSVSTSPSISCRGEYFRDCDELLLTRRRVSRRRFHALH